MVTLGVLAGVSACGGSSTAEAPQSATPASSAPEASEASSPKSVEPVLTTGEWDIRNVTVEERVVGLKGQAAGDDVRDLMVKVAKDYVLNAQSIKYNGKQGKAESTKWMLSARRYMTAGAAADWTETVTTYFREKKVSGTAAWNSMSSLTTYGLYTPDQRPSDPELPLMFDMAITKMDVDLSSDARIWVTMDTTAKFNFIDKGEPAVARLVRTQEFWLEDIGGRWKIDGWNGRFRTRTI